MFSKNNTNKIIHQKSVTVHHEKCPISKDWNTKKSAIRKESNAKKVQLEKSPNMKREQLLKRANTEKMKQEMSKTRKKYNRKWVQHESKSWKKHRKNAAKKKCTTRGKCNLKRVQNERVQRGKIATRNEYNTKKRIMKWVQHKSKRNKVQHEKSTRRKKRNTQKGETWKKYKMKKVQRGKIATPKVCNTTNGKTWKECNM